MNVESLGICLASNISKWPSKTNKTDWMRWSWGSRPCRRACCPPPSGRIGRLYSAGRHTRRSWSTPGDRRIDELDGRPQPVAVCRCSRRILSRIGYRSA